MINLEEYYYNTTCPHCGESSDPILMGNELNGHYYFEYLECNKCYGAWTTRYVLNKIESNGKTFYMPNDDLEMLASENKAMAEFLEKLGYSSDDISNIANGCHKNIKNFLNKNLVDTQTTVANETSKIVKLSLKNIDEQAIKILDGNANFVSTGLNTNSWIYKKTTIEQLFEEYLEKNGELPVNLQEIINLLKRKNATLLHLVQ